MFNSKASEQLGQVSGKVIDVWPRFRSGDFLVTLQYPRPVKLGKAFVTQIDVFIGELDCTICAESQRRSAICSGSNG